MFSVRSLARVRPQRLTGEVNREEPLDEASMRVVTGAWGPVLVLQREQA